MQNEHLVTPLLRAVRKHVFEGDAITASMAQRFITSTEMPRADGLTSTAMDVEARELRQRMEQRAETVEADDAPQAEVEGDNDSAPNQEAPPLKSVT